MDAVSAAQERSSVVAALQKAASATGSDFHYLLGTAIRESSLKPQAQSNTSSAAGLFQFVDQTWLGLVKQYGGKYGLGSMAGAIARDDDGRYHAANGEDRQAILALRKDPQIAALMAGEYANQTRGALESALGRQVCGGELYAAHFLGPDAACKLIRMNASEPHAAAAAAFPAAAGANRNVFYRPDGSSKSVREVYDWALGQPAENRLAEAAPVTSAKMTAVSASGAAADNEIAALFASVTNWQPGSGFFGGDKPLQLSPEILGLLSSDSGTG